MSEKLKRSQMLKSRKTIGEFFLAEGGGVTGKYMYLKVRFNKDKDAPSKLCVAASAIIGGAVKRNRAKRLLREVYRKMRCRLYDNCDVLLVARPRILNAEFEEIVNEFEYNAKRVGILKPENNSR